jgi:hypothetical protein
LTCPPTGSAQSGSGGRRNARGTGSPSRGNPWLPPRAIKNVARRVFRCPGSRLLSLRQIDDDNIGVVASSVEEDLFTIRADIKAQHRRVLIQSG